MKRILFGDIIFVFIVLSGYYLTDCKINDASLSPKQLMSPDALKNLLSKLMSQNASLRWCPAPKLPLTDDDCKLTACKDDKDCESRNQSCCFNGCIFTCLDKMSPPPVIDWDDELEGPVTRKESAAVLRCTNFPRPAPSEPVGCPKGYVCRMDDYDDPLEGRFSSGICVPDTVSTDALETETDESEDGLRENTRKQTVYLPGGCVLSEIQYKHMQEFMMRSYIVNCSCIAGSVECQIREKEK